MEPTTIFMAILESLLFFSDVEHESMWNKNSEYLKTVCCYAKYSKEQQLKLNYWKKNITMKITIVQDEMNISTRKYQLLLSILVIHPTKYHSLSAFIFLPYISQNPWQPSLNAVLIYSSTFKLKNQFNRTSFLLCIWIKMLKNGKM